MLCACRLSYDGEHLSGCFVLDRQILKERAANTIHRPNSLFSEDLLEIRLRECETRDILVCGDSHALEPTQTVSECGKLAATCTCVCVRTVELFGHACYLTS